MSSPSPQTETENRTLAGPTITIISAKDAAALLGIHHTTLYEAARRGEIPCRIIGRRFVFVRERLVEWMMASDSAAAG